LLASRFENNRTMRREPNSFFNSNHLYVGTSLFI